MNTPTRRVYLDHNATTPPAPEALREMADVHTRVWANPSSTHGPGQAARRVLVDARARVARFLGAEPPELVFTSGATEANHMAVLGALRARSGQARPRWVLSAVEHAGLQALADRLQGDGVPVSRIGVDAQGRLDLAQARALIGHDVAVVSVMAANNETGVCMPLAEVAALARDADAWLHVDATQLAGKAALHFHDLGVELMSLSAHKLHGPPGVGALLVRKGVALPALLPGRQERQRRGGTENLAGIAGFAAACERCASSLDADIERMRRLRDRLESALHERLPDVHVYGQATERVANTSCLRFGELASEIVLQRLERMGVVAASGSACAAGGTLPSPTLQAMGETAAHARAAVRFSLGCDTTVADIDHAVAACVLALAPLLRDTPHLETTA